MSCNRHQVADNSLYLVVANHLSFRGIVLFQRLLPDYPQVNNLVLIDPPVRRKVSHFICNCFCYSHDMRVNTSYKARYRTAVEARA